MEKILLVNGPNLNLLGEREPGLYGSTGLETIEARIEKIVREAGKTFAAFQSNHEGVLVDWIQQEGQKHCGLILNAGAFTHTSIAIRDALLARKVTLVEVHISNIYSREDFRHKSFFSDIAAGVVAGLGPYGYECAARYLLALDAQ